MSCSWESPFADCLSGAPGGDYLSRAIVPCRGAPITDTAFMGLTSCRWITITGMIAHPRQGAQSAFRPAAEDLAARLGLAGAGLRGHRSHAAVLDFPRLRQARPTSRLHALVGGRTLAVPLAMRR